MYFEQTKRLEAQMNFENLVSLVNWFVVFLKVLPVIHVENWVVITLVVESYVLI
jgi:hypothetical protein